MFTSYLKTAFRNLLRQKGYSFITIVGLVLGLTTTILILLWVEDELSFDRFHANADSICRVVTKQPGFSTPATPLPLAAALRQEVPEVVATARVLPFPGVYVQYNQNTFFEQGIILADSAFFSMFSFPLVEGDPRTLFSDPASIVLTERMARKYFGTEDPINKSIILKGPGPRRVTGILKNIPGNSHLRFDAVISTDIMKYFGLNLESWDDFFAYTYVQLQPHAALPDVAAKVESLFRRHMNGQSNISTGIQSLKEIHLAPALQYDTAIMGNTMYVYAFAVAALFVLFIACMNFINLTTAHSIVRFKDVGVRKTVGAGRLQLTVQFLVESGLVIGIAVGVSLLAAAIALPAFNQFLGKTLQIDFSDIRLVAGVIAIALMTMLLAALYPAFTLSSLTPLTGFKPDQRSKGNRRQFMRTALIVTQFSLSIGLIVGTVVIYQQVQFMRNTAPGFVKEGVVYFPLREGIARNFLAFKESVLQDPNIESVTAKEYMPTIDGPSVVASDGPVSAIDWEGRTTRERLTIEICGVEYDYRRTMGMEMVDGRDFSKERDRDAFATYILNEEAVQQMGLKSPVGKWASLNGHRGMIVGVFKNAHVKSLQYKMPPQIFTPLSDLPSQARNSQGVVLVKTRGGNLPTVLATLRQQWEKLNPEFPFEFHFLDKGIDELYNSEAKIGAISFACTVLAVGISCLGLFGMSIFLVRQKTKEIGIRKVLGASVAGVVLMLTKGFAKWVILANLIAWPLAYYFMHQWLQNYAYRVEIGWPVFLLSGALALVVALLTVSYQTVRAATANPVEALRHE